MKSNHTLHYTILAANRKKAPSKKVFYATQILAWLNSIGVWIILIVFGFYAVLNGGV